jgi:hypothetical protein
MQSFRKEMLSVWPVAIVGEHLLSRNASDRRRGQGSPPHCSVAVPTARPSPGRLLLVLPQHPGLEREDIVQHAVDPAALQAVVGDQSTVAEKVPEAKAEPAVDPYLALGKLILQQLEATVESSHPSPFAAVSHAVPSTSTRPFTTRVLTRGSAGSL